MVSWLIGEAAASVRCADFDYTAVGFATNYAAFLFWARPFQAWIATRPRGAPAAVLRDALVISAIAAAVDYGATPKRFTPGWEFVLSRRAMAVVYGAVAVGLAAGVALTERRRLG